MFTFLPFYVSYLYIFFHPFVLVCHSLVFLHQLLFILPSFPFSFSSPCILLLFFLLRLLLFPSFHQFQSSCLSFPFLHQLFNPFSRPFLFLSLHQTSFLHFSSCYASYLSFLSPVCIILSFSSFLHQFHLSFNYHDFLKMRQ